MLPVIIPSLLAVITYLIHIGPVVALQNYEVSHTLYFLNQIVPKYPYPSISNKQIDNFLDKSKTNHKTTPTQKTTSNTSIRLNQDHGKPNQVISFSKQPTPQKISINDLYQLPLFLNSQKVQSSNQIKNIRICSFLQKIYQFHRNWNFSPAEFWQQIIKLWIGQYGVLGISCQQSVKSLKNFVNLLLSFNLNTKTEE